MPLARAGSRRAVRGLGGLSESERDLLLKGEIGRGRGIRRSA
ncbi:hypothetical protein I549_1647 [Mycobacterium avium subsp. avium 2285 (R)]|nr:hypothetical protein I549_1647 [Mycobacterium avium subsp. avium 2285 (R)]